MCKMLFYGETFGNWEKEVHPLPQGLADGYRKLIYFCLNLDFHITFKIILHLLNLLEHCIVCGDNQHELMVNSNNTVFQV